MDLQERGFVVLPGPLPASRLPALADAYDEAVASASPSDLRVGSTSTRVSDFVNRGSAFDALYVFPPLLAACRDLIGGPFKLSSFHARTLHPHVPVEELHKDVQAESADWPLLAFILMIDDFFPDNGATRFVPGSRQRLHAPDASEAVPACGPSGSLLIFDGTTWHGHGANVTDRPRRSLQGAFIPRGGKAAIDFSACMDSGTRARLGPLALELVLP